MRVATVPRLPAAAPPRLLLGPALVAAAIALVALLAGRNQNTALIGLSLALLIGIAGLRDRRLIIPIVIVMMPLEILRDAAITLPGSSSPGIDRFTNSTLFNVRVAILGAGAAWALTARPGWERTLPRGGLILPALLLLGVFAMGTVHTISRGSEHLPQAEGALVPLGSASTEALLATAALALYIALLLLIPMLVRDWRTFRWCMGTFVGVGVLLALAGIYQQVTGGFFWNPALGLADVPRINTTFRDPNIYARLMIMAIVIGIGVAFAAPRNWRLPLLAGAVVPCALALIFTNSRSGFLVAAISLPLTALVMPLSVRARVLATIGSVAGMAVLLVVAVIVFDAHFLDRVATLGAGSEALGPRQTLIEGGWRMFADHPLSGVGLAGFQDAFQGPYRQYYEQLEFRVSLSHTDVITILAELGLVGAVAVTFLFARFGFTMLNVARHSAPGDRALVMSLGVAVLAIFGSAQAEGRLLSEPYLWLLLGLALAAEGIVQRERAAASQEDAPG